MKNTDDVPHTDHNYQQHPGVDKNVDAPRHDHKGWYSNGYLPHFDEPGAIQAITFRLNDSLPQDLIADWKAELRWLKGLSGTDRREAELRRRIAKWEDAGHGACWLRNEPIGSLVEGALLYFDGTRYALIAWCIMPNHVHAMIEPREGWPLGGIVQSWKSFTAREANRILGRRGTFWFPEYFDRFIRDEHHFQFAVRYIEENSVIAGLVSRADEWQFSSAWKGRLRASPGASTILSTRDPATDTNETGVRATIPRETRD